VNWRIAGSFAVLVAVSSPVSADDGCKAKAADLAAFAKGLPGDSYVLPSSALHLVQRADAVAAPKATVGGTVELADGKLEQGGRSYEPTDRMLAQGLALDHDRAVTAAKPQESVPYVVAIDGDETWSDVVTTAGVLRAAGFGKLLLAFRATAIPPPPHSALDDVVAKSTEGHAAAVARALEKVVHGCPSMIKMFGQVATIETDKGEFVKGQVEQALVDCACNVDLPSVRSAMYQLFGGASPVGYLAVELSDSGKPLALAGKTPWKDAQKQIKPGASLHVTVK